MLYQPTGSGQTDCLWGSPMVCTDSTEEKEERKREREKKRERERSGERNNQQGGTFFSSAEFLKGLQFFPGCSTQPRGEVCQEWRSQSEGTIWGGNLYILRLPNIWTLFSFSSADHLMNLFKWISFIVFFIRWSDIPCGWWVVLLVYFTDLLFVILGQVYGPVSPHQDYLVFEGQFQNKVSYVILLCRIWLNQGSRNTILSFLFLILIDDLIPGWRSRGNPDHQICVQEVIRLKSYSAKE